MNQLNSLLPLLIPLIVIQLALMVAALLDLSRRPAETVRGGNKLVWALVIIFVNIIGPIIYFVVGRENE